MRHRHVHRHPHHHARVVYRPTRRTGCIGGCVSLGFLLLAFGLVFGMMGVGTCAGMLGSAPSGRHGRP